MKKPATIVAPSILSADFALLADESARMARSGADWLHVDCMDGHFVPNLTIGPPVVKSLRKHTQLYLDVHLMLSEPWKWVGALGAAGANGVTFHLECFCDNAAGRDYDAADPGPYLPALSPKALARVRALAREVRAAGMRPGLALRPRTPVAAARALLDDSEFDLLLAMTVEPGFGGQKFMTSVMSKVREARELYPTLDIQVDGGVAPATVGAAVDAGANVLVAGSAVFGAPDATEAIACLRAGGRTS